MEGMKAYQELISLRLHFTSDYDYFKYLGKTKRISESKLETKKDVFHYRRIERKYKDELTNFIVSNIISNPNVWIGDLVKIDAEKKYKDWKKRQESLKYIIKQDLLKISETGTSCDLWKVINDNHPPILRAYLGSKICLETLIATNEVLNFVPYWDKKINETFIWSGVSRLIAKYRPFLNIDKKEIKSIMRETLL